MHLNRIQNKFKIKTQEQTIMTKLIENPKHTGKTTKPVEVKEARKDAFYVHPDDIDIPEGLNVRDMEAETQTDDYKQLKALILKHGVKVPIQVKSNPNADGTRNKGFRKYILVDGGRRTAAVNELRSEGHDISSILALKNKGMTEEETLVSMFVMNGGKSLNPIEKAEGVRRFIDVYNYSPKQVAETIGETTATISNLYKLCKMPQKIKNYITGSAITATLAIQLSRKAKSDSEFISMIEQLVVDVDNLNEPQEATVPEISFESATSEEVVAPKKKTKVTAKHAEKFLGTKNTTKLLSSVYDACVTSEIKTPQVEFLGKLLECIKANPTQEQLLALFNS